MGVTPPGGASYVNVYGRDITEERHAHEQILQLVQELKSARDEAMQATQAKSQFLASMSHELRTPLNAIIGYSEMLHEEAEDLGQVGFLPDLQKIQGAGRHLLSLINDILDLSKIEAGKIEVEREPTDLAALLRSVMSQLEPQVRQDVLELRTRIPLELDLITSDGARLRQIMINLIGNALKFTERGYVEVVVETLPHTSTPARISVHDTGIGIPADRLGAIFDAFEQAESSTTRKFGGTGLGLPISRALCELLGYQLHVSSQPGAGTTFTIELLTHDGLRDVAHTDAVGETEHAT
jgi:signal transduction histidine kinase